MLPAELLDHIFSFLDTLALKACSKAHPLFSRLAERRLYMHIFIDPLAEEVCNLILENPRFLDYPHTLEILLTRDPLVMSIVPIIPRMSNLISLSFTHSHTFNQRKEFFAIYRNCFQQSSFQQLSLSFFFYLPFSVLDDAKCIKQLTLSDCTPDEDEPISSSPSSRLSLETLVLSGYHDTYLHRWAMRWVTRLTTLELRDLRPHLGWSVFPELLVACSNSLTSLHLDMRDRCYTKELAFTLSALKRLKRLSITSMITGSKWALPEIIRLINTAPTIPDVVLRFHCDFSASVFLARLDWSLLDHLQSNFTGKRPRIDLCVTDRCEMNLGNVLAANEALMDLVKRGLVNLRSEHFK